MGDKGIGVGDDLGEGMQCSEHPYRAGTNPGGICAFCLQEKLGKLVSSSKSGNPFHPAPPPPSSSSSSPSFRSDYFSGSSGGIGGSHTASGRSKIPFLSATLKKKKSSSSSSAYGSYGGGGRKFVATSNNSSSASTTAVGGSLVLKRSKSVAPRPVAGAPDVGGILEAAVSTVSADSPRKKSFWSFLIISSSSSTSSSTSVNYNNNTSSSNSSKRRPSSSSSGEGFVGSVRDPKNHPPQPPQESVKPSQPGSSNLAEEVPNKEEAKPSNRKVDLATVGEEVDSPNGSQASSSFGRKVARSRSVGCGSRSFSGDFLERISTGFGDCTLRRVESQREAKPKISLHHRGDHDGGDEHQRIKERVKCGGIFGGLGMISSSSSYWLSAAAAAEEDDFDTGSGGGRLSAIARGSGRTRSWGWAFASPIRAFRPSSTSKPYAITAAATNAITSINSDLNASTSVGVSSSGGGGKISDAPSLLLPVGG